MFTTGDINISFKEPEVYPVSDPDKTPYEYFKYFVTDEMKSWYYLKENHFCGNNMPK